MAVRRGSTTTCRAPRSRPSSKYCIAGGMVSAGLLADQDEHVGLGDVGERERQAAVDAERARLPAAAADDMQNRPL